jgi:hypothetical protein
MDTFIKSALGYAPPVVSNKHFNRTKRLTTGKSGAAVWELDSGEILKIYPTRTPRSIRDVVISTILSNARGNFSPHVHEIGFLPSWTQTPPNNAQPYMVCSKLQGEELYKYKPNNTIVDIGVLLGLFTTMKSFYMICSSHSDLHPHNIFVDTSTIPPAVRLLDFDMASSPHLTQHSIEDPHPSKRNFRLATVLYTHGKSILQRMPSYIKQDSDSFQLYSILGWFASTNKNIHPLLDIIHHLHSREELCSEAIRYLAAMYHTKRFVF